MPDISLKRLMIFNSSEGQHESREGDKLLYHWTKDSDVSQNDKINDVCLCDASVNVGHRLSMDTSESNQKQKLVLYFERTVVLILEIEPEQSIWMAVHVHSNLPDTDPPIGTNNIPVGATEQIMKNIYERFCLLNGTFRTIAYEACEHHWIENQDERATFIRDTTRTICENYFSAILPDIHLNSILTNVSSLYSYILYLDLNPLTLMRVNSFINHLVCINANQISHTILLFNDQLIWSSLDMCDTRILYGYLVSVVIKDALQEELSKEVSKVRRIKESMPIYLSCDPNMDESGRDTIKSYLSVFRSRNMTLGLIMCEPNLHDLIEKCEKILTSDSRLGVIPLASLAQSVGQNYLKASQQQQPNAAPSGSSTPSQAAAAAAEYICMDQIDASVSWPLNMDKEHLMLQSSTSENLGFDGQSRKSRLIKYLIELEPEFSSIEQELSCQMEEFYARTLTDSWLLATKSNFRTIYSLHHSRNSSLSEAQQSANILKLNLSRTKP